MKVLIGYSMRSGSTLLQHILNGHSQLRSFSDISSMFALIQILARLPIRGHVCVKPMDLLFLQRRIDFDRFFDKFLWLARDPRDSYLSTVESGYAYLFWRRGARRAGVDVSLLERWKRVYRTYLDHPERWHLIHYERLVGEPETTVAEILDYLGLAYEPLFPFKRFERATGGDYKIAQHTNVTRRSAKRHTKELSPEQLAVFEAILGPEMEALGYR